MDAERDPDSKAKRREEGIPKGGPNGGKGSTLHITVRLLTLKAVRTYLYDSMFALKGWAKKLRSDRQAPETTKTKSSDIILRHRLKTCLLLHGFNPKTVLISSRLFFFISDWIYKVISHFNLIILNS